MAKAPADLVRFQSISRDGILVAAAGRYQQLVEASTINLDLLGGPEQDSRLAAFETFLNCWVGDLQLLVLIRPAGPDDDSPARRRFLAVISCQLPRPDLAAAAIRLRAAAETAVAGLAQVGLTARRLDRDGVRAVLADYFPPAATAVEERPEELVVGPVHTRTLAVAAWPQAAHPGWLSCLINWPADLTISYHYRPVPLDLAQAKLSRKLAELDSRQRQLARRGQPADSIAADAYDSAVELRQAIQRGRQKLFLVSLAVTVRAESSEAADKLAGQLETLLAGRLFRVDRCRYRQVDGLATTLPRGRNELGRWRNLNSACAALTFPFVGSQLADPGGIVYGLSPANNSLVLVDRYRLANANSLILAQSGAGKSYLAKVEILRQLDAGVDIIVIDPEGEYQALAEARGGQLVRFRPRDPERLNLLDRQLWTAADGQLNLARLAELLELLVGFEPADGLLAERLLERLYGRTGPGQSPVWADLVALAPAEAPSLAGRLERFGSSRLGQVLSRPTNLALDQRLVVFLVDDWPADQRPALALLLSTWVRALARCQPKPRLLVIDEVWLLLETPLAGRRLAALARRARKDYLGICFISQQADDFLSAPAGRVIASQAAFKMLLRSDATAIKTLARQFRLSPVEQDFLLTAARGQALFLAGDRHATVEVVASPSEHPLITTDPAELAGRNSPATTVGQPAESRLTAARQAGAGG